MLNTGLECKIYLGINDDGTVEGLMLSLYQKDHFMVSLRDLLRRFEPPVPHQRVSVKFIPVFEEDEQKIFEKEIITYDVSRSLDHNIRSDVYCWCDNYTMAAACHGMIHRFYVIELNINCPFNKTCID